MISNRHSRGTGKGPIFKPTLTQTIVFAAAAGIILLVANRSSDAPQWAVPAVSLLIGAAGFSLAVAMADARLRGRGKNAFWLLLFFGPLVAAAKVLELVPAEQTELQVITLLVGCIVAAPLAIWGAVELSARD